jgi:putative FmdB family regulatory protein
MPLHDYECDGCGCVFEDVLQKFHDAPLKKCSECGKNKLRRVLNGGIHVSVKNASTIGNLADRNTKANKNKIQEMQHKKNEGKPSVSKPWHHSNAAATNKEINAMTSKQKANYILEGGK